METEKQSVFQIMMDPTKRYYRYFALIFICFLGFGSYFCYDTPAALEDQFKRDLKISTSTFTVFYSVYSWPNVILSFFGGILIDRVLGIRLGAIIFASFILVGQVLFGVGALVDQIWLMDVARFIFG